MLKFDLITFETYLIESNISFSFLKFSSGVIFLYFLISESEVNATITLPNLLAFSIILRLDAKLNGHIHTNSFNHYILIFLLYLLDLNLNDLNLNEN